MVLHYLYYLSSRDKRLSQDELSILRALPVWPCHVKQSTSQSPNYISANQGRFCKHSKMLMPWVAELELFVDPEIVKGKESLLKLLGIDVMSVEVVWEYVKIGIPTSFDEVGVQAYKVFIQYLAAHKVRSINIALNGFGSLCNPRSLFDHKDSVFSAAFRRHKKVRFLHPDLQSDSLRDFWMAVGLKRGPDSGVMADVDFLDCARAIEARNNDTSDRSFNQDAEKVAKQLCWDLPLLRQWRDHVWGKISSLCIFLVEHNVDEEPIYRQARMRKLAARETYDCLADLGRKSDKSIVWSQVAFPKETPAPFVYGKLPNGGFPSVEKVVDHIKYLIDMLDMLSLEDVPEYLKDMQASYGYLSDRISSTSGVRGIQDAKIWINLDTTDTTTISATNIKDALLPASLLCLNCPTDPLPLRVARKFLVPYEPLLKALGCQSVVQPTLRPRNSANSSEFPMAASVAKMRELRDQEILIDVIFEVDGQEKKAHRIVMAAVSAYCQAQFSGEWGRSLQQVTKIRLEDIKYKTLSQMVDFAYSGEINWPTLTDRTNNEEIAEKLDELLDLLQATDMWFLTRLHDITEYFILAHSDL